MDVWQSLQLLNKQRKINKKGAQNQGPNARKAAEIDAFLAKTFGFGKGKKQKRFEALQEDIRKLVRKKGTTPPKPYQTEGIFRIMEFGMRALCGDDTGLGKTIMALYCLKLNPHIKHAVVVCPVSVKYNWKKEAWKHLKISSVVLSGTSVPRRGIVSAPRLIIINYDILEYWADALLKLEPEMVIFDEMDGISNLDTAKYKASRLLCRGHHDDQPVQHIIGLTATAIRNRVAELWALANLIRPDLYPSFTDFADRYCGPTLGFRGIEYKGAEHLEELNADINKHFFIRRRKDVVLTGRLPKVRKVILLDIEDRKQYEDARDNFLEWLTKVAPHKVPKAAKAEGLVRIGYLIRLAAKLKRKPLRRWIGKFLHNKPGEKMIIFAVHTFMVRGYYERYKQRSLVVDGKVKGLKRQETFDKFTKERRWRLLFGNIRAAGAGWNGDVASRIAVIQLPWTPGAITQLEGRIDRLTQQKRCRYTYLLGRDTIEERLAKILEDKGMISNAVLDGEPIEDRVDIYSKLCEALLEEKKEDRQQQPVKKKKRRHI